MDERQKSREWVTTVLLNAPFILVTRGWMDETPNPMEKGYPCFIKCPFNTCRGAEGHQNWCFSATFSMRKSLEFRSSSSEDLALFNAISNSLKTLGREFSSN